MVYDDIDFEVDEDDEPSDADPDNDLPPGFAAFHSRFPAIVDHDFSEDAEPETMPVPGNTELDQRIKTYLEDLLFPRR